MTVLSSVTMEVPRLCLRRPQSRLPYAFAMALVQAMRSAVPLESLARMGEDWEVHALE